MFGFDDIFKEAKTVLFVTAHPDDVDVFFAGTIKLLTQKNKNAFVVVVTNGAMGSRENIVSEKKLSQERIKEQANALKALGVDEDHFSTLGYRDGEVENNMQLIGEIAYKVRKLKPEVVCTHEPHGFYYGREDGTFFVNHRDHRNVGISVTDAVYPFSRDRSFFKEHFLEEGIGYHVVEKLLFCGSDPKNSEIDITGVVKAKEKALLSHKTQFDKTKIKRILDRSRVGENYYESFNLVTLAR